jgi:type I restriction-modification system DNA methylase subunit
LAKAKREEQKQPVEQILWASADKLRKNMDAAEYKHIVLGLIFLKYISDSFYELFHKLEAGGGDYAGADPNDPFEYRAENVFYVPPQARWDYLQGRAKLASIGKDIDDAMDAIEKDNASLKGVLPKEYAKEKLDKQSLGGLIDIISTIAFGDSVSRSNDVLGKVYEYFLGQFALAEGKKGGQFYTPRCVVQLLVEMLQPYKGRVLDPCCGSGGMFVQSEKFIEAHADHYNGKAKKTKKLFDSVVSVYGQESNQTTWRLCKMNLALRGIDSSNVKWNNEGSPAKLFLNTQIPTCLWFLSRNKTKDNSGNYRNRADEILFIDARNSGHLLNRRTRELSNDDIQKIAFTYHEWRKIKGKYKDIKGFCNSASIKRVRELDYVLTPGRYVGLPDEEDDFNFAERFTGLKAEFEAQLEEEKKLNKIILQNLAQVELK